jgi:hypothetical protein
MRINACVHQRTVMALAHILAVLAAAEMGKQRSHQRHKLESDGNAIVNQEDLADVLAIYV